MTLSEFVKCLLILEQQGYGQYRIVAEYNYDLYPVDKIEIADDERGKVIQVY